LMAIEAKRQPDAARLLFGLGIRHVGAVTARDLLKRFVTLPKLRAVVERAHAPRAGAAGRGSGCPFARRARSEGRVAVHRWRGAGGGRGAGRFLPRTAQRGGVGRSPVRSLAAGLCRRNEGQRGRRQDRGLHRQARNDEPRRGQGAGRGAGRAGGGVGPPRPT
jgi:hypothetical protein